MRPRRLRRLALTGAGAILAGTGIGYGIGQSDAATVTLTGSLGVGPRWSTVVDCPCEPVRYVPWLSQRSIANGVGRLDRRLSAPTAADVQAQPNVAGFSLGAVVAVGFIWDNPERAQGITFTLLGSPDTPEGRPSKGQGHKGRNGLPAGDWSNVTFVAVQYDPVADPMSQPNMLAIINSRMSTHIDGYNGLDLDNPDAVEVDPRTGAQTLWFRSDVLPMLKWRDWFTSDERMAELDAYYRPKIEAAYVRKVDLNTNPKAQEPQWEPSKSYLPKAMSDDIELSRSRMTSPSRPSAATTRIATTARERTTSDTSASRAGTKSDRRRSDRAQGDRR